MSPHFNDSLVLIPGRRRPGLGSLCVLASIGWIASVSGQQLVAPADQGSVRDHPRWLRLGPFDFNPAISVGTLYDDNVALNNQAPRKDLIWSISPIISAVVGESGSPRISLDYRPTALFFTKNPDLDSVDQFADMKGAYPFARLTLGVTQTYLAASGGVADVGNRVTRQVYSTTLSSKYELSEKTSFEINGRQEIANYERLISSREWVNNNWFNYQLTPKVATSIGAGFGSLESDQNPNQTYEQVLARAVYNAVEKLDVSIAAGGEVRQIEGSEKQGFSPIFNIGGTYSPMVSTRITLQARRQQQNSAALVGEDFISSGFLVSATHRLLERYLLSLSIGYDNYEYVSLTGGAGLNRTDNIYSIRGGVEVALTPHLSVGMNYFYRRDESSSTFSFVNNQVNMLASWAY